MGGTIVARREDSENGRGRDFAQEEGGGGGAPWRRHQQRTRHRRLPPSAAVPCRPPHLPQLIHVLLVSGHHVAHQVQLGVGRQRGQDGLKDLDGGVVPLQAAGRRLGGKRAGHTGAGTGHCKLATMECRSTGASTGERRIGNFLAEDGRPACSGCRAASQHRQEGMGGAAYRSRGTGRRAAQPCAGSTPGDATRGVSAAGRASSSGLAHPRLPPCLPRAWRPAAPRTLLCLPRKKRPSSMMCSRFGSTGSPSGPSTSSCDLAGKGCTSGARQGGSTAGSGTRRQAARRSSPGRFFREAAGTWLWLTQASAAVGETAAVAACVTACQLARAPASKLPAPRQPWCMPGCPARGRARRWYTRHQGAGSSDTSTEQAPVLRRPAPAHLHRRVQHHHLGARAPHVQRRLQVCAYRLVVPPASRRRGGQAGRARGWVSSMDLNPLRRGQSNGWAGRRSGRRQGTESRGGAGREG